MSSHGYPPARPCRMHVEDCGSWMYGIVNIDRFKWKCRSWNGWPINEHVNLTPQRTLPAICPDLYAALPIRGPPA